MGSAFFRAANRRPNGNRRWIDIAYVIASVAAILLLRSCVAAWNEVEVVPYSQFEQALKDGQVSEVAIDESTLVGTLATPSPRGATHLLTQRVEPQLADRLAAFKVRYYAERHNTWLRELASWVVPTLFFLAMWIFIQHRFAGAQGLGGGLMAIGKSKAKVYVETDTKVTFADVAGVDEAKAELQEIVDFLKQPQEHGRLGARLPKGILLVGPPGTGKTLLARAVAGEAGVPFFSINGSEFVEMFVGVGAARVRDLFDHAREQAPAIIFIDEIDALGRARGMPGFGGHDEKEQTLNQLLSEMDGFDPRKGLVLLAATNRPEILDPALLRAGRFDRQVLVDRPDRVGRVQILKVHARRISLAPGVELGQVAELTPGFSGADLANLVNEAALQATRRGGQAVEMEDFTLAIERLVAGLEKRNRLLNPHERETVAYHELGHAFVALALKGSDVIHKVSIIPRGIGSLGYTIQRPTEDRYLMTRGELENKMAVLLGGRASEEIVFGEASTGAADDLAKATDIAHGMVTRFGMIPALGPVTYDGEPPRFLEGSALTISQRTHGEGTAQKIDEAVRELLMGAHSRATAILRGKRGALDVAASRLMAQETLRGEEVRALADAAPPASLTA